MKDLSRYETALLVSPEHEGYGLVNPKYSSTSLSCKTLTTFCLFNLGSLDQMGDLNARDKAKYGESFKCGDISLASCKNCSYSDFGITLINSEYLFTAESAENTESREKYLLSYFIISALSVISAVNKYNSENRLEAKAKTDSSLSLDDLEILDTLALNSSNIKSGDIILIPLSYNWNNISNALPLIMQENTTLAFTINILNLNPEVYKTPCLLAIPSFISSPSFNASSAVNFDFEAILLNNSFFNSTSMQCLRDLKSNASKSISLENLLISSLNSSGTSNFNSAISTTNNIKPHYINNFSLTATTYDKAGNSAVHTVNITVDTTKSNGIFSSSRNFKSDIVLSPDDFGSVLQSFSNHFPIQARILLQNLFNSFPSSKQLNNIANHYPGSLKGRFSMTNIGVNNDIPIPHDLNIENNYLDKFSLLGISDATILELRNQTASMDITSINVSGTSGDTVTNPYNNVDGSGSPQNTSTTTPVVTIYNPASSTNYKIWLKVTAGTGWDYIISDEKFNVTADATDPGDVSSWKTLTPWGSYKDTGVTVAANDFKDLYLAFSLRRSGTGTATISVLGEVV